MADTKVTVNLELTGVAGFVEGMKAADRTTQQFGNIMKKGGSGMAAMGAKFRQFTSSFRMWALSIMFMGMMIERTFTRLAKYATTTFTKIMESNNLAGSAIQRLSAGFTYLGFVVGSIINRFLGPLMPLIMTLITWFSNWMQTHRKLVTWIIILGIALGALMGIGGAFILGFGGILQMFVNIIMLVIGLNYWLGVLGITWKTLFLETAALLGVVALLILLGIILLNLKRVTGDWGTFWKTILGVMLADFAMFGDGVLAIGRAMFSPIMQLIYYLMKGYNILAAKVGKTPISNEIMEGFKAFGEGSIKKYWMATPLQDSLKNWMQTSDFWKPVGNVAEKFTLSELTSIPGAIEGATGIPLTQTNNITVNATTNASADDIAKTINDAIKKQTNTYSGYTPR